jgi:hypothetical protein
MQLAAGLIMVGIGVFFVPVIPHTLLDVVLSPSELQDQSKIEETLDLLQRANGLWITLWVICGLIVAGTSLAGLRLTSTPFKSEA